MTATTTNLESQILKATKGAIYEAINERLSRYDSPLNKMVDKVLDNHSTELIELIDNKVISLISTEDFKKAIKDAMTHKLTKVLVAKMGGELEKRVNELNQNPTTRAKITLGLTKLINEL